METNNKKEMSKSTWLITAKTNLHVGDESIMGYEIIDKSVQRDSLMNLPCINSSSLKGALNEYCCQNESELELSSDQIHHIFGSYKKDKSKEFTKGTTSFFDAGILFLPVQDNNKMYKLAYCDEIIDSFITKSGLFGAKLKKEDILNPVESKAHKVSLEKFKEICDNDELPIIARNVLENGESKNLWYEQIIPPETIFYTFMQSPEGILEKAINEKMIQIGANATIGYGYCKFKNLSYEEK